MSFVSALSVVSPRRQRRKRSPFLSVNTSSARSAPARIPRKGGRAHVSPRLLFTDQPLGPRPETRDRDQPMHGRPQLFVPGPGPLDRGVRALDRISSDPRSR